MAVYECEVQAPHMQFNSSIHLVLCVVLIKVIALVLGTVATDRADVEHAVAELDECAAFDRDVDIRECVHRKVEETLEPVLAEVVLEALPGQDDVQIK